MLKEAREVFVFGYFYSCVSMCAITAERILKDIFAQSILLWLDGQPALPNDDARQALESFGSNEIREFLMKAGAMDENLKTAFGKLAALRNQYTHANIAGRNLEKDAGYAIQYLDQIIEVTVSIFKDFTIQGGKLVPKSIESEN